MILAIETSCDETAIALVDPMISPSVHGGRPKIMVERIASQVDLHAQYGGVVPELAAREHLRSLPALVGEVLGDSGISSVNLIAVTTGPGLKGSLLMGVNFAKGLSLANNIPVVGINHIEAHLLSPLMENSGLDFPYLGVVVSGGHTEIHEVLGVGKYHLIERTVDDAAGEAFDKCAALLGIAYPGGAALSRCAATMSGTFVDSANPYHVASSRTLLSFSGLKTSFRMGLDKLKKSGHEIDLARACAAVECAIIETMRARVAAAVSSTGLKSIGIAGGVAANGPLRSALSEVGRVFATKLSWCGDNAAMIGFVAALRQDAGYHDNSTEIRARWPIEEKG